MGNEMTNRATMDVAPGMKAKGAVALAFQTREMIECLGMMQMAKMDPRDAEQVRARLKTAAQNEALAVAAEYIYVKGGTEVTGLSIRAAEALGRAFGNVDFGMREVVDPDAPEDQTSCQCWCWDMETNTRQSEIFHVPHYRTKGVWEGNHRVGTERVRIEDQREIDEMVRSRGSRIKRACILAVIPADVQEEFALECDKTLANKIAKLVSAKGEEGGIRDVIEGMLVKLETSYRVTRCMVADRFQKKHGGSDKVATNALYGLDNRQIVMLFRILTGLRDGIATPADYFKGASTERSVAAQPAKAVANGVDAIAKAISTATRQSDEKGTAGASDAQGGLSPQTDAKTPQKASKAPSAKAKQGMLDVEDVI